MATITVTTDWVTPTGVYTDVTWANPSNAGTENGTYATAASSTSAYTTQHSLYAYGFRFADPRPSLPAGYTNFTITQIEGRAKGHNAKTSLAGGQHISPIAFSLSKYTDTTPWSLPRVGPNNIQNDPAPSNTNTWMPAVAMTPAQLNSNVNTAGGNTFLPSFWYADAAASYNQGPVLMLGIRNATGTAVGTWNIDAIQGRYTYTYDLPDPETGASIGARHFFDYR